MYRIAGSSLCLMVAASVCGLPALALDSLAAGALSAEDRTDGAAAAICEVGAYIDQPVLHHPMLLAAYTRAAPNPAAARSSRADPGTALPTEPGDPGADTAGAGEAPPDTALSLMHPGPRPPRIAARTVGDEQPEDWMRTAERPIPEPGLWAVLIAGFLGVCAMARRRIFSS